MLTTAAGRAFIAYTSDATRATILKMLAGHPETRGSSLLDTRFVNALVEQTRERGYGSNFGEWTEEPKFGGYAVPICNSSGEAMVSLNVIFLTSAIKEA